MYPVNILIRLREYAGWYESSSGAHVVMFVFWRCGTVHVLSVRFYLIKECDWHYSISRHRGTSPWGMDLRTLSNFHVKLCFIPLENANDVFCTSQLSVTWQRVRRDKRPNQTGWDFLKLLHSLLKINKNWLRIFYFSLVIRFSSQCK